MSAQPKRGPTKIPTAMMHLDRPCFTCKAEPRVEGTSYCKGHLNERRRARQARQRAKEKAVREAKKQRLAAVEECY
jgi:hypothetical protein